MTKLTLGTKHYSATDAPFKVPADLVAQTAAVLARKGAGKTYTGSVMAEELLGSGSQVIVIDPLNAWWGLRSSKSGKRAGFAVVIFGGRQGDMALTEEMARPIADAVAENPGLSCVLSLRHMRKNAMRRFVTDFAEQLFHRKGETRLATPVHLFIDEADMFAPQRVFKGGERMLGAMEDIVRRGRQAGIGITMITQRPQSLNKDVLTQIELLIVGQLTGPHDRKAVSEWVDLNADRQKMGAMLGSLPELQIGELWFWSPSWLRAFERVHVRERTTFDSSATPKSGARVREPKKRHRVDLDRIKQQIGEAAKRADEVDPKKLQREIADLKKKLANGNGKAVAKAEPEVVTTIVEGYTREKVHIIVEQHLASRDKSWQHAVDQYALRIKRAAIGDLSQAIGTGVALPSAKISVAPTKERHVVKARPPSQPSASISPVREVAPLPKIVDGDLNTKSERAILSILAQRWNRG